jgi:hypothetical protein
MTEIDERISLELFEDVRGVFSESVVCEVDAHERQPLWHEGDGEWYVTTRSCLHCGKDSSVTLICDKFKRTIEKSLILGSVPCGVCKKRNMLSDIVIGFDKRSG